MTGLTLPWRLLAELVSTRLRAILAVTLWELVRYERAHQLQLGEDTLTCLRRVVGDDHPHTLHLAHNLAAA